MIELNRIYCGDSWELSKQLDDNSIDCIMTSPPYWALRNYNIENQFGLESNFNDYISKLCNLFELIKPKLKDSGSVWINLGDTYFGGGNNRGNTKEISDKQKSNRGAVGQVNLNWKTMKYSHKCLCQIPARFSIEMINRGWILRNEVIWFKPNAMPSSVKDRFTVDYEKLFFFTKSTKYYFKTQREPHKIESIKRACHARTSNELKENKYSIGYLGENTSYENMIDRLKNHKLRAVHPDGRNKRCVWQISLKSNHSLHYATYPEQLCETPIKASCPENGIVLDPFIGSGTTAIVAKRLNRNFIGFELNPDYVKICENRLK